jgi:hypothetical protein
MPDMSIPPAWAPFSVFAEGVVAVLRLLMIVVLGIVLMGLLLLEVKCLAVKSEIS